MTNLLRLVRRLDSLVDQPPEHHDQGSDVRPGRRQNDERATRGRSRLLVPRAATPTHPSDAATGEVEPSVARLHARALAVVEALFDAARRRREAPEELAAAAARLVAIGDELVDEVSASERMVPLTLVSYATATTFVVPHSVNVAILGIRVAVGAGFSDERTRTICQAGLAHDVGSVLLDEPLPDHEEDGREGFDPVLQHPSWSREILEDAGPGLADAAGVVHQVYERLDGSGYPGGLSGEDILIESRVLGAVDLLDGTLHPRARDRDGVKRSGSLGIQRLVKMRRQFGEEVLKGVVRGIGLFPVGTLVRLSSGEVARVKENRPDNPMRPLVEVLEFGGGRPGSGRPRAMDLVDMPHVYVSGAQSAPDLEQPTPPESGAEAATEEDESALRDP